MLLVAWLGGKKSKDFYRGGRSSSWWVVAIAMIGACMSGVSFVSVPGMVGTSGFSYLQMCLGFIAGYLVIAFVLSPLYFRLGVVSVYQYLEQRFGVASYKSGALFFFISKLLGASVRLFLVCLVLQLLVFDPLGLPFFLNALISCAIVFAYTFRGGVKSVIWTDVLKTGCMVLSVALSIYFIAGYFGTGLKGTFGLVSSSPMSRIFWFDDPDSPQYFWKQFFGGLLMVIAMTGLDQDMMQRTLACKNAKEGRKNLIVSSLLQTVVIAMFLFLGVLLYNFADATGVSETGDKLFPAVAMGGILPPVVGVLFVLGLVSSAYGAGGSALTALTTSFTVDILGTKRDGVRKVVHIGMAIAMAVTIVVFNAVCSTSAIDAVYRLASYTYGPILGMFAFGLMTRLKVRDRGVPVVTVLAPLICLVLDLNSEKWFSGYHFGYELLALNAGLVFLGLLILSRRPGAALRPRKEG